MKINIPPIKSQGIKTKLIPWIIAILDAGDIKIERWVEPFAGTCVVPLNVKAQCYLLSDINPHLINFMRAMQANEITTSIARKFLQEAAKKLELNGETYYYEMRENFNKNADPLTFLFLNRSCFNGMMRFNAKREYNVPFCRKPDRFRSAYITKICNQIEIMSNFLRYNDIVLQCADFRPILKNTNSGDLIYCDPPYIDRYRDYYSGWTETDEHDLFNVLKSSRSLFILSTWHHNQYRSNKYIDSLWDHFHVHTRDHFYHLGGREENRHAMTEALVTNIPDKGQIPSSNHVRTRKAAQISLI